MTEAGNARRARRRRNGVDLHTHSTSSDGTLTAVELYAAMSEAGLWLAALSDHDTLEGFHQLRAAGLGADPAHLPGSDGPPATGPHLIPAIEFDSVRTPDLDPWPGDVHILGYGVDPDAPALEGVLLKLRDWRRERFQRSPPGQYYCVGLLGFLESGVSTPAARLS